jgi:hypothetical protein
MKKKLFIIWVFAIIVIFSMKLYAAESALRPWEKNSWYWSYHGMPLLLLGGSDDDNLFQWSEQALLAQLDRLAAVGGNLIRNTMSSRQDKGFEVYPFKKKMAANRIVCMISVNGTRNTGIVSSGC